MAKPVTIRTAAKHTDIDDQMTDVCVSWKEDYGYRSARLTKEQELNKSGEVADSPRYYVLVLDGKATEINYGFYKINGEYSLESAHLMEEGWF